MTTDASYLALAADAIGGLAPYEPGKPAEALEREFGIRDAIKLASNENPHPLPPGVVAAITARAGAVGRYPDGAAFALRAVLAERLGVQPTQLTLGNGSNDVLVLLAETFLTPANSAVYDQYSFVVYRLAVQACGAEARVAPSRPRDAAQQPLGHDLAAMLGMIDATTRLVFIANPNNPTGTWVDAAELHEFLSALPDHVIAVLDEAYYEYAEPHTGAGSIGWLAEFPNLVIVRTFSKAYGLAGLRIGYGVSSEGIAELLNRVRQPFNTNLVAQQAARAALNEVDWVADCVAATARGLAALRTGLERLGFACIPSCANFLLVDCGAAATASACNEFLLRHGVIVRPVANYGLPEYLRISVGLPAENERLLAALAAFREAQR